MNQSDIINFWRLLKHEKQTELRAIIPNKEIKSFHFSNEDELLRLCRELDGNYNLYLGVNERKEFGTKGEDVIKIGIIPIDVDCINKPATDEDIVEANIVSAQIIIDAQLQGFKKPSVIFSGNGYQLFFSIPKIDINNSNRKEVEEKIQEFQRRLIEKYSNSKVKLDNVGDLPRIMRLAGTFNLKSRTTSKFIEINLEEDALLKEYILDLKLTSNLIVGGLSEELKDKIKNDSVVQKFMSGDLQSKKSRSEAEMSLVCKLIQLGLDKKQIFNVVANCKIGKWQESSVGYRELTYKKGIEIITEERLKQNKNPSLDDLYLIYKKWLHIEDTKRVDVVLATYLTHQLEGTPIWLIIVGNSGDGKTEQVVALNKCPHFRMLHKITSKTLVSGSKDVRDLAPDLNNKIVVIPDMAQLLQLHPQEKGELWGQLRDLFDGYAGIDAGTGKRVKYEGIRVTLIACSTPKIDSQILVHQDLGTRELIYRSEDVCDENTLMSMAFKNEEMEKQMKQELSEITCNFLKDKQIVRKEITEEELTELMNISMFISRVRASAEYDSYTNELRNFVYPERPTRIIKQLKRLYLALLSLDKDYQKERAFQILWHIAKSCAFPIRLSVFEYFVRDFLNRDMVFEYSTSKIANELRNGKRGIQRELYILWNMGILDKNDKEEGGRWEPTQYWRLNISNKFIQSYIKFIKKPKEEVKEIESSL